MSLLLDALKKAAEKKAKKSAEQSESLDSTEIDSTELETQVDATHVDATKVDSSEYDNTELDTRIEATEVDNSELYAQADSTEVDNTELDSPADVTEVESTEYIDPVDNTDLDVTHEHTYVDDTVDNSGLNDEDHTLLIADEDEDAIELGSTTGDQDATQTEITDTYSAPRIPPEEDELTDDDVTAFMGDGLRGDNEPVEKTESSTISQDDTTVTNPDSLSLTNVDYDEDLSLDRQGQDDTELSLDSPTELEHEDSTLTEGLILEDVPGQDRTTEYSEQAAPASIDIDQLTSDQTVTIKSTTATRTFAPDNYDRTLFKLGDTDVSKIFPGMKSEDEKVMTPDYAKKVFLNKSQGIKASGLKIFGGGWSISSSSGFDVGSISVAGRV